MFTDCWRKAIDGRKFTAAVILGASKAFDSVNHNILLPKLVCYGVLNGSHV